MPEPAAHPTRLLKWVAVFARWFFRLLLTVTLLLALAWGALHGWIVPRIGEYRAFLETRASSALGVPVRLGAISARTEGLIPTFELTDVALLDAQGRQALRLPQVTLVISPRSLLSRSFQQIHIRGLDVDVRRARDGELWVAGFDVGRAGDGSGAADWLFSQPEVVVRAGRVRWSDELRSAAPLAMEQVDITLRSRRWRHALRLDATPPGGFGERFSLMARMREPVLAFGSAGWQNWSGQMYASFPQVDLSRLGQHVDLGRTTLSQGEGALRAWVDVDRGVWAGGAADVAIAQLDMRLSPELEPLRLRDVRGRLGGRRDASGFRVFTQGLRFSSELRGAKGSAPTTFAKWPGGNLRLEFQHAQGKAPERGQLDADQLDVAALVRIAARMPLPDAMRSALERYTPQGVVERVSARWQGPLDAPLTYQAKGSVAQLSLAAGQDTLTTAQAGGSTTPGVRGAHVDFDMNQAGGKAEVQMSEGALVLPGVFEDSLVPIDTLQAQVAWKINGSNLSVEVPRAEFANADAAGSAQARWQTSDSATSSSKSRFPGVLDLKGSLSRADGTRVHRYLPLAVPADARHYVRDAIQAGRASRVDFTVRGDLHDMPFHPSRTSEFRIASRVQGVTFAYVPARLQGANDVAWPALVKLSGELVFEGAGMQVKGASGSFAGFPQLQASNVQAQISDLEHSVVKVSATARGPLAQMLGFVHASPVAAMTGAALGSATGTGNAELALNLQLPIAKLGASTVQGNVTLLGNDVRITADTPLLAQAQGAVQFSESGFSIVGAKAAALGGEVRVDGGMAGASNAASVGGVRPVEIRAQGSATAQGLAQASELGLLADLARKASGSAAYNMTLRVRKGVPEVSLTTDLRGMALDLPAPFGKAAESRLPVRFENQLTAKSLANSNANPSAPLQERLSVEVGTLAHLEYERALGTGAATVLRGAIAVGVPPAERPNLPAAGVEVNARFDALDIDAWQSALASAAAPPGPSPALIGGQKASVAAPPKRPSAPSSAATDVLQSYLPQVFALQAKSLQVQGRTLHDLVVGGKRQSGVWQATLDARELAGYVEYREAAGPNQTNAGLTARLSRLQVPESAVEEVDSLLDEEPETLPGLDIVVDAFELRGRKLGRLEIDARNRGGPGGTREWRLAKFNLSTPDAVFTASGDWARSAGARGAEDALARRTALGFALDVRDSGALLTRLGMPDVVRRGKGRLEGRIAWVGSPISPDYRSMTGQVHLDVGAGQFLQADPGLAKLLGVLSLQSLPRRFALDFRDLFSKGFAFDFVRGDVTVECGVASTNNLQMKGVSAAVLMEGSANIELETQNLHVVVVPEINALTASLVATAINPVIGLGSFLAQVFLRGPLIAAATQEYSVQGTWADPDVIKLPRRRLNEAVRAAGQPLGVGTPSAATPPEDAFILQEPVP